MADDNKPNQTNVEDPKESVEQPAEEKPVDKPAEETVEAPAKDKVIEDVKTEELPVDALEQASEEVAEAEETEDDKVPELKNEKSERHSSIGLAIGVAVLVALVLIALGVLAYQNSDVTTDVDEDTMTTETEQPVSSDEFSEAQVDETLTELETDLQELDQELEQLGEEDLTDEALDLQ